MVASLLFVKSGSRLVVTVHIPEGPFKSEVEHWKKVLTDQGWILKDEVVGNSLTVPIKIALRNLSQRIKNAVVFSPG